MYNHEVLIHHWTLDGGSLVKYNLSLWGHLILCFPTFYAMIGVKLSKWKEDYKKSVFMGKLLLVIYGITFFVHGIMAQDADLKHGLILNFFISSAFMVFGLWGGTDK